MLTNAVKNEQLLSTRHLVQQCVLACIAARRYVHATFLAERAAAAKAGRCTDAALGVQAKGTLEHKEGAQDMVTAADVAVQELVVTMLEAPQYRRRFVAPAPLGGRAAAQGAFEVVGEEELEEHQCAPEALQDIFSRRIARFAPFIDEAERSEAFTKATKLLLDGGQKPPSSGDVFTVFIDPIDATLAFIDGNTIAPMTLVGVAKNGVPVAGVCSRIFDDDAAAPQCALPGFLSFVVEDGPCVLWGHHLAGRPATPPPAPETLDTTFSGTTTAPAQKTLLRALEPQRRRPARGGGNKIMLVALRAARKRYPDVFAAGTKAGTPAVDAADVFPSIAGLKKWDVCAPHAFLRWLGTDVVEVSRDGKTVAPVSYENHAASQEAVARGSTMLAVASPKVQAEVLRRIDKGPESEEEPSKPHL